MVVDLVRFRTSRWLHAVRFIIIRLISRRLVVVVIRLRRVIGFIGRLLVIIRGLIGTGLAVVDDIIIVVGYRVAIAYSIWMDTPIDLVQYGQISNGEPVWLAHH